MASSIGTYQKLEWNEMPQEAGGRSRMVYVSKGELDNTRWVAKLAPPIEAKLVAEEVAYKISKILNWNTIAKTKYLHPFTNQSPKYAKYSSMMNELMESEQSPNGFTFQKFVNGCTARQYIYSQPTNQPIVMSLDKRSHHRAFLLDVILGRGDTRLENTMLSSFTGEFSEVDNEQIGSKYGFSDTLDKFPVLYAAKIDDIVLNEVLQIETNSILKIRDKYYRRTEEFVLSWNQNTETPLNLKAEVRVFKTAFSQIMQNIEVLKFSIQSLKNSGKEISPKLLNREYVQQMKRRQKEDEEIYQSLFIKGLDSLSVSDCLNYVYTWIEIGHCVVLYSEFDNKKHERYVYYEGNESAAQFSRIIYVNVFSRRKLLETGGWPMQLESDGLKAVAIDEALKITDDYKFQHSHSFQLGIKTKEQDASDD